MEVVKNEWKVDCQHIVNSLVKRAKIVGRSTSRSQYGFRIFQGFCEAPFTEVLASFERSLNNSDVIKRNNPSSTEIIVQSGFVDSNTMFLYLYAINENNPIIKFEIRQSDELLTYVNCQYSPRDPNLVQRRTWDRSMKQKSTMMFASKSIIRV